MLRKIAFCLLVASGAFLSSCKTADEPTHQQTPAFGAPVSTIPWNQPQSWEGGAGGLGAMRPNEYE